MIDVIAVIILGVLCAGLLVERFFYAKEMNRQLGEATRAVLSRNMNEFLASTEPVKKVKDEPGDPEQVDIAQLKDKEFDTMIKKM